MPQSRNRPTEQYRSPGDVRPDKKKKAELKQQRAGTFNLDNDLDFGYQSITKWQCISKQAHVITDASILFSELTAIIFLI